MNYKLLLLATVCFFSNGLDAMKRKPATEEQKKATKAMQPQVIEKTLVDTAKAYEKNQSDDNADAFLDAYNKYDKFLGRLDKTRVVRFLKNQKISQPVIDFAKNNANIVPSPEEFNNLKNKNKALENDIKEAKKNKGTSEEDKKTIEALEADIKKLNKEINDWDVSHKAWEDHAADLQKQIDENANKGNQEAVDKLKKELADLEVKQFVEAQASKNAIDSLNVEINDLKEKLAEAKLSPELKNAREDIKNAFAELEKANDEKEFVNLLNSEKSKIQAAIDKYAKIKDADQDVVKEAQDALDNASFDDLLSDDVKIKRAKANAEAKKARNLAKGNDENAFNTAKNDALKAINELKALAPAKGVDVAMADKLAQKVTDFKFSGKKKKERKITEKDALVLDAEKKMSDAAIALEAKATQANWNALDNAIKAYRGLDKTLKGFEDEAGVGIYKDMLEEYKDKLEVEKPVSEPEKTPEDLVKGALGGNAPAKGAYTDQNKAAIRDYLGDNADKKTKAEMQALKTYLLDKDWDNNDMIAYGVNDAIDDAKA